MTLLARLVRRGEIGRLTSELVDIGFTTYKDAGGYDMFCGRDERLKEIGTRLDELGGRKLMQRVYGDVERRMYEKHGLVMYGLSIEWDGIGDWRD